MNRIFSCLSSRLHDVLQLLSTTVFATLARPR